MNLKLIFLTIFSILGIFFFVIMVHEVFHTIHMGNSNGICLTWNTKIKDNVQDGFLIALTQFDLNKFNNLESFNNIRDLSEKYVRILDLILFTLLPFIVGYLIRGLKNGKV